MDKILALVDGSAYSRSLCRHVAWIARRLDASVEIMHVLGRREGAASSDLSGALHLGARSALMEELAALDAQRAKLSHAKGHAILEDAKKILEEDGVTSVTARLRKGDLLDAVREVEADTRMIAIGKRGEGADFASGHLGSNLERIVRTSKVPVFVASREFKPITTVLIAYDGSAGARVAIDRIAASPGYTDMEICVLCVGRDDEATRTTVNDAVAKLQQAGLNATPRIMAGEPEAVLGKLVVDEAFGLLVMGAFGHSRIRSLIIGSTTTAMIQTAKIPVLLYR